MKFKNLTTLAMIALVALGVSLFAYSQSVAVREASGVWSRAYQNQSATYGRAGWYVATYAFAKDGGATGNIDLDIEVPDNFIVTDGLIDVIAPVLPGGTGYTNAITLQTAGDILAAATNTMIAVELQQTVPAGTAATSIKLTDDRTLYLVRGTTGAITSGCFNVYLKGYQSF